MAGKKARRPADGSYSRAWRNVSKIILRPGIRMMMRLDWQRSGEHPGDGPVILAANHLSYMDIFAVSLFADSARRYPVFLAKSSLFTIPVRRPGHRPARASCRSTAARPTRRWCSSRRPSWPPGTTPA